MFDSTKLRALRKTGKYQNYSADLSIYRIWRSDFILKALGKSLKGKLEKRLPQICISMYHHCFGVAQVRKVSGYRKRDQLADCCYDLHQVMLAAREHKGTYGFCHGWFGLVGWSIVPSHKPESLGSVLSQLGHIPRFWI